MPAEAPTTTSASATGGKRCPKCGKGKKSGKLSCCARGGAWFQKCGDGDDSKFDHTWMEGIQACNSGSPFRIGKPLQAMLLHERVVTYPMNGTWLQNIRREQMSTDGVTNVFTVGVMGSINSVDPAEIVAFFGFLLIAVVT